MKKYIYWGIVVVVVAALVWFFWPAQKAAAEGLSCPVGQMVQTNIVTPEVIAVPAVTHTEVVIDTPAWDETVIDSAAYTSCNYVGAPSGDYKNSSCTQTSSQWWLNVYKKVNHPAVTHIVHHDAVTHEVTIIDTPAVVGVPAVTEDICVTDPDYVAPIILDPVVKAISSGQSGGGRHPVWTTSGWYCPQPLRAEADPMNRCPGQHVGDNVTGSSNPKGLQLQLIDLLNQLIVLLQKLQATK